MEKLNKRVISFILALALIITLLPAASVKAKTDNSLPRPTLKLSINTEKRAVNVALGRVDDATGYTIQCSANKKFKNKASITIKSNVVRSVNVKKLKKNRTYYFRIRANYGKKHSAWSKVKKIKFK